MKKPKHTKIQTKDGPKTVSRTISIQSAVSTRICVCHWCTLEYGCVEM